MQFRSTQFLILLAATSASAQIGIGTIDTNNFAGDAILPPGSINITETLLSAVAAGTVGDDGSGFNDFRGVVRLPNGNFILSDGPNGGPPNGSPFKFFEISADGTILAVVNQTLINGANGDFGITDLSWDKLTGPESRVWGGRAKGIISYDWASQVFDLNPFNPASNIIPGSPNGLHLLDNFQGADIRATAIGQVGGQQILVSSDNNRGPLGAPDLAEVNYHIMGIPLPAFPQLQLSTPSTTGILGAFDGGRNGVAFDMTRNTVWWHMDDRDNSLNPNRSGTRFEEMDLDGNLTGQVIQGVRAIGGRALGCSMYVDAQGNAVLTYLVDTGSGVDNPLGITTGDDMIVQMFAGFQYGSSCGGDIAFETEPFIGNAGWTLTLKNAPATAPAAFLARGRAATPPGLLLPGLLNCGVLIDLPSLSVAGPVPITGGGASFVRNLPNLPTLIGAEAAFQWLELSAAGGLPLSLSDAGDVRIGSNL